MAHILDRSNSKEVLPSWQKRLLSSTVKITNNIKKGIEKLLINYTRPKWSKLLEQIRNRIQNPRYLDSNDAIRDFESLVFVIYREKLFAEKTERETFKIKKDLLKFILFLRSLSNNSGLIKKRQSGYSAFSHWMDAVYIYLENDPHPTLQGIQEIASHDTLEDTDFSLESKSSQIRWSNAKKVYNQLVKYGGAETIHNVETQFTKPPVTEKYYTRDDKIQDNYEYKNINLTLLDREEARIERNHAYLTRIREKTDDTTFRKKLADTLSNIRNIDAYILLSQGNKQTFIEGRKKMERKCQEIVEFLLPRAKEIAPSYYVQLVSEIESLKMTYKLEFPLLGHTSSNQVFQKAIEESYRQGVVFESVQNRIISEKTTTYRVTLEARKIRL